MRCGFAAVNKRTAVRSAVRPQQLSGLTKLRGWRRLLLLFQWPEFFNLKYSLHFKITFIYSETDKFEIKYHSVCNSRVTWIEAGEIRENADIYLIKTGKNSYWSWYLKSKNLIQALLLLQTLRYVHIFIIHYTSIVT